MTAHSTANDHDDADDWVYAQLPAATLAAGEPHDRSFPPGQFIQTVSGRRFLLADALPERGTVAGHNWRTLCQLHPHFTAHAALLALPSADRVRACISVMERMASPDIYGYMCSVDSSSPFLMVFSHHGRDPRFLLSHMQPKAKAKMFRSLVKYVIALITERHVVPRDYFMNAGKSNYLLSVGNRWFIADIKNVELVRDAAEGIRVARMAQLDEELDRAMVSVGLQGELKAQLLKEFNKMLATPGTRMRTRSHSTNCHKKQKK